MERAKNSGVVDQLPPALHARKPRFRKTAPDEKETERTGRTGKHNKYDESKDNGKNIEDTLPHQTKVTRQSSTPHVFLDPTPGSRREIPAASLTTPFQAPALQHETDTRHDSASKKAERSMSLPRKPEQNVDRSPSPTKSGRGLRITGEHVLSWRHDSMPRGHRRSEPNAHFNKEVYNNTRQTSGLRQGTSRYGDSIYACPSHSTDPQSHPIQERGAR